MCGFVVRVLSTLQLSQALMRRRPLSLMFDVNCSERASWAVLTMSSSKHCTTSRYSPPICLPAEPEAAIFFTHSVVLKRFCARLHRPRSSNLRNYSQVADWPSSCFVRSVSNQPRVIAPVLI
jgi:hypothetical protein